MPMISKYLPISFMYSQKMSFNNKVKLKRTKQNITSLICWNHGNHLLNVVLVMTVDFFLWEGWWKLGCTRMTAS